MPRYLLPALSGVLLALCFYPFYYPPLVLVALAPLYYFVHLPHRTAREVFVAGCLTGIIVTPILFVSTLAQLNSGWGGEYYTWVMRLSSIPFSLGESALFGGMALGWWYLRSRSPLLNVLAAASGYLLLERIMTFVLGGYYPDSLASAAVSLPFALTVAALGGIPLVSFLLAAFSAALGELALAYNKNLHALWPLGVAAVLCVFVVGFSASRVPQLAAATLAVSVIQTAPTSPFELFLGEWHGSAFYDPLLRAQLQEAAQGSELVVYPYSVVESDLSATQDVAVGEWLTAFSAASTSVVLWNSTVRDKKLYTEYALWQGGHEQLYQKHVLYAFSDYTPWWAQLFGVEKSPTSTAAGDSYGPLRVGSLQVGGLACSELHQDSYARAQAAQADVLLAVGVDAFFPGPLIGNYSRTIARYRAAENGEPVVRANLFGPSALIDAHGAVIAELPYGKRGTLRGALPIQKVLTLYRRLGEWPVYILLLVSLAAALYLRFISQVKSLGSVGR